MDEIRGVRKKNVVKIIQSLVKQGGCTKNELVFYTGLSLSTIDLNTHKPQVSEN